MGGLVGTRTRRSASLPFQKPKNSPVGRVAFLRDGPPRRDCMATKFKDGTMKSILSNPKWVHSFFIQVPYPVVHKLYESIVDQTKEGQ